MGVQGGVSVGVVVSVVRDPLDRVTLQTQKGTRSISKEHYEHIRCNEGLALSQQNRATNQCHHGKSCRCNVRMKQMLKQKC